MIFRSIGKIYVGNLWMILRCDHELGRYLRKLYEMEFYGCRKLQRPSHGEHITIVSKYEPVANMKTDWYYWNDMAVWFDIDLNPSHNGNAVWYPISSPMINLMRLDMGLTPSPFIPLHLCIGYFNSGLPENFSEISQDFS